MGDDAVGDEVVRLLDVEVVDLRIELDRLDPLDNVEPTAVVDHHHPGPHRGRGHERQVCAVVGQAGDGLDRGASSPKSSRDVVHVAGQERDAAADEPVTSTRVVGIGTERDPSLLPVRVIGAIAHTTRTETGGVTGEVHVLGGRREDATGGERDAGALERARRVHAHDARRAEVAAAVVGEDFVPRDDLLDRLRRAIGHGDRCPRHDALIRVADDHDVLVVLGEEADQLPLGEVGVLELVDEDVAEALAPPLEHVGVLTEELHDEQQEVVEVGGRRLGEPLLVLGVDLGEPVLGRRRRLGERLLGQDQLVLHRRDRVVQPAGREPLRVQVHVPADVVDEAGGVGLVVDRERRAVAEHARLAPQDAGACGVERRHPHPVRHAAHQLGDALLHLTRGLVREGDREDLERRHVTLADQVRDPVGQQAGLARSRARDDEHRTVGRRDRLALDRVQARDEVVTDPSEAGLLLSPRLAHRRHRGIVQVFAPVR